MRELHIFLNAISSVSGELFFKTLAQHLCFETGAACVHVALHAKDDCNTMVNIFTGGTVQVSEPLIYFTKNTFWQNLVSEDQWFCCECAGESHPNDFLLNKLGMNSCVAVPLFIEGQPGGSFAVMGKNPFRDAQFVRTLLDSFAPRVAHEAIQKQLEAELRHRLWLAQAALDAIPTPIFFMDKEASFTGWNQAFADFTGLPGNSDQQCLRLDGKIGIYDSETRQRLKNGGTIVIETSVERADGMRRNVLLHKAGFGGANGQPIDGLVGTMIDVTELRTAEEKAAHLTNYDRLTDLPSQVLFGDRLLNEITRARRHHERLAVFSADLDHFKKINTVFGREKGDQLLRVVARRIQQTIREQDTVARLGGDSFNLLLSNIRFEEDAAIIARKIHEVLNEPFHLDGQEIFLTTSIGIALFPLDGDDAQTMIKSSDIALQRAKEGGRNRHTFFAPGMNDRADEQMRLQNSLRRALEREEFTLHYQPQYDAQRNEMVGVEALIRWQHPDYGMINPDQFIPLAEHLGLIMPIGEWVLRTACHDAKAWNQQGQPLLRVAVNISPREFEQPDLFEKIRRIIHETGVDPGCLSLEITEGAVMQDVDFAINVLTDLKQLGIHLSVDDFGTGYSSLSYLKRFPIDLLKIDRSFIMDIPRESDDIAIVSAVISMAHKLKLKVLAEGIETPEQRDLLHSLRCDEFQGFLFSKPVAARQLFQ